MSSTSLPAAARAAADRSRRCRDGADLPPEVFELRHRWVTGVLVGLALGLTVWVLAPGLPRSPAVPLEPLLVFVGLTAAKALVALRPWRSLSDRSSRTLRATATSAGCFAAASLVVALTGGAAEAHFVFVVLVPLVALYEMAVPFVVAVAFVFLEHGLIGSLWPPAVFGYGYGSVQDVWALAALHSALFAAGCAGSLLAWRGARTARAEAARVVGLLRHRATHDELTGLANRAGLAQALGDALTGAPQDLAVVVVDLNRFKEVNDTLGHDAGDELLSGVARVMAEGVGDRGVLARLGGDEFALVLPGADGPAACALAEQLREQVRERSSVAGIALDLDLSAGVALHTAQRQLGPEQVRAAGGELLRHADIAMYAAKRGGGGAVVYDAAMDHHSTARLEVARELRTAVAQREQLVLHYQPKVSLSEGACDGAPGRLVGVEALVRWEHPVRGFMPPGDFIPLLESTDLVHAFTAYMVDLALDQAQAWYLSGHEVPIAVNAFPRCLTHPDFLPHVAQALHRRGLPPHLLRLEITEDALVADPETASAVITELRQLGVATSIDDFGTGYSSLSYLRRLPVDEVKLDRAFVTGLGSRNAAEDGEGGDEVLVASIIDLAHRLGMKVVAEGVEEPAETQVLRSLGCDVAQGYLFARPAPAAALAPELLATARRRWAPVPQRSAPVEDLSTGETTGPASAGLGSSSG